MATRYWRGASANIAGTYTITIANTWTAADTATITVDSIAFTITIGSLVTTAQVATTIKEAWEGSTFTDTTASATISPADGGAKLIPQFSEMTATVSGSVVTLKSNGSSPAWLAGKPFTIDSVTESTASTGTATGAAGVTATSQRHWDQVDNWSANTVPVDSDTIVFDSGAVDLAHALTTTIQPLKVDKYKKYSGNVGLRPINLDNSSKPYNEYRSPRYLTFDDNSITTTLNLEMGDGPGSGLFMVDNGAGQAVVNLFGKGGQRLDAGIPCTVWKGTHVSNVVNNLAGDLGIAIFSGETAVVATLRTGNGPSSQASTVCSSGVTLTTVVMNGGGLSTDSAITTSTQNAGTWQHNTGTVTTGNILGGQCFPIGGATWTTLTIGSGGEFNTTRGTATFTITNTIQLYKGAKFIDPAGRAGNVVFKLNQCTLADVTLVLAPNKTFTLS